MTTQIEPTTLHFIAIPYDVAEEARRTRKDRHGHALAVQIGETAPCRVCLEISQPSEELLLLSYRPADDDTPYAEIGPIFIHARRCEPYATLDTFLAAFRSRELVLRAYGYDGRIVDATVAKPGAAQRIAVRHTSYTCFDFKIIRV